MEKSNKKIKVRFIKPCEIRDGNELTSVIVNQSTEVTITPCGVLVMSNSTGIIAGFKEWTSFEVMPNV